MAAEGRHAAVVSSLTVNHEGGGWRLEGGGWRVEGGGWGGWGLRWRLGGPLKLNR